MAERKRTILAEVQILHHETAKKDILTINISGADKVCRTQDYKLLTLPEGYRRSLRQELIGLGGIPAWPTVENGSVQRYHKASTYPAKENSFKLIVKVQRPLTALRSLPKRRLPFKTSNTGGTATCKDRRFARFSKSYGKLDPNNHANLKHIDAKAATRL